MGDHLKVDVDFVRRTSDQLGRIVQGLSSATANQDGARAIFGHQGLAGAMDDFHGNWGVHRERLVGSAQALAKMAASSADAYEGTDTELARALAPPDPGASGGSNSRGGPR